MKVLFLDIDSVMVVWNHYKANHQEINLIWLISHQNAVTALNEILDKTGCEIVLSSDHRWNHSLNQLDEIFKYNKCHKSPIDITPLSNRFNSMDLDNIRAHEIMMFLEKNPVDNWVGVDDLQLNINLFEKEMNNHFILTLNGLSQVKNKVINLFNI